MPSRPSRYGENWTRDELILAFDLYCRIPFAKTKATNPAVQALAKLLDRSPGSIARKLGNFGSFDPTLKKRQISGLANTSMLDEQVWNEFHANWNDLVVEAARLRESRGDMNISLDNADDFAPPSGPSERMALRSQRLHQSFFRSAILSAYEGKCCVTSLGVAACLQASHIIPWAVDMRRRADPCNGVCLSATFDRLFDAGLMTFDDNFRVVFAAELVKSRDPVVREDLLRFEGRRIILPKRFRPSHDCLEWHRLNLFSGK